MFYSPLRYPGGKNCIFSFTSTLFYQNQLLGCNYAEPYAGGAGLALRLLFEGYVNHIHINDLDPAIYSFWSAVLNRSEEYCNWLQDVEVTIQNWFKYRELFSCASEIDSFELAKSTFFLNRTNVSGILKGGVIGGKSQKGKYKIDARFNKRDLISRIKRISAIKKYISISNMDGVDFIKKISNRKETFFVYIDPPYFQKGADLYMNFCSAEDHINLSKQINSLKKDWMVSYDKHEFILNLYNKQRIVSYNLSQSASNRVGEELLVFSDKIDFEESLNTLKSPIPFQQ